MYAFDCVMKSVKSSSARVFQKMRLGLVCCVCLGCLAASAYCGCMLQCTRFFTLREHLCACPVVDTTMCSAVKATLH